MLVFENNTLKLCYAVLFKNFPVRINIIYSLQAPNKQILLKDATSSRSVGK